MEIRAVRAGDDEAILAILEPVIRNGETYALDRDMSRDAMLAYWLAPDKRTFVACEAGRPVGTFYIRANQSGGGRHVCNCGYVTGSFVTGRGVARAMCLRSLELARESGFRAMQFNFVISTNVRAVRLWTFLGFETVGRLPEAFDHPSLGPVDALVMYRFL
ncbi:GNAT family N-acetyltransferase [Acetobacter oeni]|uniref:Acetyltransferase n=1 Tax=Acetobacter oeni TaxID=304077 RepID=A0A511XNZ3_9PROT|nr:GNAT family N-acetyltransferase [Acetobacter oeni]MBB3881626.1 L-amino acid N-acyltransferase YncA [Acetobacter oeni]NHO17564.1 GNAT family N-acetyltransferase [Acetobacter oeni]GBR00948.1 acetyltransferase [Acetobacter oeni LMG 21952]GEN64619.1 acetyltransferase [Acetobacter oeni]